MERIARIMEAFWLSLAVLSAVWAAYVLAVHGWKEGKAWVLFPAVCTGMWWYRRFMRRKLARWAEQQRGDGGHNE